MIKIDTNHHEVKIKLLQLVVSNSLLTTIGLFINLFIVVIAFWESVNHLFLLSWFSSIFLILIARVSLLKLYINNHPKFTIHLTEIVFKILTLLSVILLSAGIQIIFPIDMPFKQAFLTIIIASLAAGSVMTLSYYKNLIACYLSILVLPFAFSIYLQDTNIHSMIAFLIIVFLVMLINFSQKYHHSIVDIIISDLIIKESKRELKLYEKNFSSIFFEVPIGIFTYDTALIIKEVNQSFLSLLKAEKDQIVGLNMNQLEDRSILPTLTIVLDGNQGFYEGSYNTQISKEKISIQMKTVPMYDSNNRVKGGLGIIEDITARIEAEEQIRYQAFYDHLTGLANRITLNNHIQQQLEQLKIKKSYSAILFIDLDHFKDINDSLGHHIGDSVLKIFASKISILVSNSDTVARLGGDEFVILLAHHNKSLESATQYANRVAMQIHNSMKESIAIEGHLLHINMSIGITILTPKDNNVNDILKHADIAMYKAKQLGRDTTCFFEDKMGEQIKDQLRLNQELREALKEDQFELYYQPITKLETDQEESSIVSCEALIRWNHPTRGTVYPDDFIPYAESNDLILEIGEWVIKRVCIDYQELQGYVKNIAINISAKQFNEKSFTQTIIKTFQEYDVDPRNIELELTESVILDNLTSTIEKMNYLKSQGFTVAMDDFGTGYSSLSYLKSLPFDFLKIDRAFIKNILINESDASLVKTILAISKQFNFSVIAEGVETYEHIEFLKEHNCNFIQGYIISKAVPKDAFKKLLS